MIPLMGSQAGSAAILSALVLLSALPWSIDTLICTVSGLLENRVTSHDCFPLKDWNLQVCIHKETIQGGCTSTASSGSQTEEPAQQNTQDGSRLTGFLDCLKYECVATKCKVPYFLTLPRMRLVQLGQPFFQRGHCTKDAGKALIASMASSFSV